MCLHTYITTTDPEGAVRVYIYIHRYKYVYIYMLPVYIMYRSMFLYI